MGLVTAPTLLAAEQQPLLAQLVARRFSHHGDVDIAIELVQASEGVSRTMKLAMVQAELAIDALARLPDCEARDALVSLAIKVVTRTH